MLLENKKIVLGVCGGIAAFKAASLASMLKKQGAEVRCIMTENATHFITPLTMRELTGNPVSVSMWDDAPQWNVEHIALANWCDVLVIAPATANIIGKISAGIADDMLTTVVMATKAPVILSPAMNSNMYSNPIVQGNIKKLSALDYHFIEPESGLLACGVTGPGRLPEPEMICRYIEFITSQTGTLAKKKVIVTAGGTMEDIDPVRYITNHSSGRMGFAIAKAAAFAGAEVFLVAAPTELTTPIGVTRINVRTTLEMKEAVDGLYDTCDVVVKAAAVADYRVKAPAKEKIKKSDANLVLELEKNPDILYELGKRKSKQILVGFAAETTNVLEYGRKKLAKKNLNMLVANDVSADGAGFKSTTNIATLLYPDGTNEMLEKMSKDDLAAIIIDRISKMFK